MSAIYRSIAIAICFTCSFAVLPSAPALAVSAKEKMATCKFGADSQGLKGKERATFLKNCMANRNDPRGGAPSARAPAGNGPEPDGPPQPRI